MKREILGPVSIESGAFEIFFRMHFTVQKRQQARDAEGNRNDHGEDQYRHAPAPAKEKIEIVIVRISSALAVDEDVQNISDSVDQR